MQTIWKMRICFDFRDVSSASSSCIFATQSKGALAVQMNVVVLLFRLGCIITFLQHGMYADSLCVIGEKLFVELKQKTSLTGKCCPSETVLQDLFVGYFKCFVRDQVYSQDRVSHLFSSYSSVRIRGLAGFDRNMSHFT